MNTLSNKACCSATREKETFSDWTDFDEFSSAISHSLEFVATSVIVPYANVGLPEKWYRCIHCGTIWRLVEPDPPFGGLWKKVP